MMTTHSINDNSRKIGLLNSKEAKKATYSTALLFSEPLPVARVEAGQACKLNHLQMRDMREREVVNEGERGLFKQSP
jgi:septum formation inhibitor-activating ATPase MinD